MTAVSAPTFPWLRDRRIAALLGALDGNGEEARVVGGAVRNTLLGEPVADWDVATTAMPHRATERAVARGWKVVPTGIDHGTITIIIEGVPFEVTTLREDIETDGRHAVVRFGRDFRADAFRRDFTINALSVSPDGTLHDYAGGLADIEHRRVRFIGDADRRIAEDYLRILRLFRFHARFGEGPIDPESLAAAIRGSAGLARLSRERVLAEMLKLLVARRAPAIMVEIDGAGFLLAVFGSVARPPVLSRLAGIEADLAIEPDAIRRLAALTVFVREDAVRLATRLRLSNAQAARLEAVAIAGEALTDQPPRPRAARALLYRLKPDAYRDTILVAWARAGKANWRPALDLAERWPVPAMPFGGADAARLGIAPGPRVGQVLAEAERRWIAADFPAGATERAAILAAAAAQPPVAAPATPSKAPGTSSL